MCDHVRLAIVVLALAALVAGCVGYRPMDSDGTRSAGTRRSQSQYHTVVAGDTLYSIAWEAGHDYRAVARWNGIGSPYLLHPGQRIRLKPPQSDKGRIVVAAGDTLYGLAEEVGVDFRELAAWNNIPPPYTIRPGQVLRTTPPGSARRKAGAPSSSSGESSSSSKASRRSTAQVGAWVWPADGPIVRRFSARGVNKGLDIGGRRGAPVQAAAPGTVVYTGSGLRGYGQLIIIKHNRDFLSAYAHSDRTYVEEGDVIKRGQKIAAMGSSGTDQVKLHFEIRYRGSPVDPLKYLPKR